ncbi:uncharacterized protein LOC129790540 [Lutzomyia longipalpis]|uniref:uncharacterized protein LOC129790540 n=1 Tax=Lutzomyia longipalpis TaxID=7200 RepID=UPI00248462F4|nr:uncharacterized protein LOC129790540 [Lutzomyia longipalpis]
MKHQQVVVDYWTMVKTSFTYLILVAGAWLMFRLFHAVFWFPKILQQKHEEIARRIEYHAKRLQEALPKDEQEPEGAVNNVPATPAPSENETTTSGEEAKKEK